MKCLLFFFLMTVLSTSLHVPVATAAASIAKTIVVNRSGTGDFRSVQEAINSVPDYNNQWIKIHLASGVYRFDREGAQKTSIEWGDYASDSRGHDTASCGTFTSYASNIVVAGITFKVKFTRRPACMREVEAYMIRSLVQNTYDGYSHTKQAVAALIAGDKSSLYSCGFVGYQDTLADLFGRHYFKGCYIQGVTDFIFGLGQSIYEVSTRTCRDSIRVHGSP
ncbi:pectinesterase [Musa troglodytarum]|uniref:pectinesterase n=1 Tax=Musa troglodytarum TaxID=320322 RepID=A0A9E7EK14_9LILI|nr:pectinesterase [Musa troglodytarum]